ncbi:hypothetical protein [Labedaea rhizosphaerae]|uniref:Peptidase inhibitor family I36 n=1 Tax=Labedaea rhizosphaerae TaxID=598644 RepID=A0A4R6SB15_LABRH|nr:hypothetical protein [Labedaea rhizosphaerae]TDP96647.1 hypothetical protein EV186_104635 [Labedaea rhizosphaerae]
MMSTLVRRVGLTIAAGVVLGATWTGTAAAAPAQSADKAVVAVDSATPATATASGRKWCGFNYDTCEASRLEFVHYGYQTSPLYWAGTDNTCLPGSQCNGYYFDWWD